MTPKINQDRRRPRRHRPPSGPISGASQSPSAPVSRTPQSVQPSGGAPYSQRHDGRRFDRGQKFDGRQKFDRGQKSIIVARPTPLGRLATKTENIGVLSELAPRANGEKLRVYALGGLEEIGRNCTVFEMGNDIVVVDLGLMFPEEDMPGIDFIIPNVEALKDKLKNIRALIVTHGHMDHIGGIPYLMDKLGNPPLYTAPLTAGIIRKRVEEFPRNPKINFVTVEHADARFNLGANFIFEPFHINHNISDAFGAALHTPVGTILITGDFKFDYTPVNDEPADLNRIALFGAKGVLALMSDSTNAESPGHQISERTVGEELEKIIANAPGRIIIATFSSLLTRAQLILESAEKHGRKVLIEGRSMNANIELAHQLGYLHYQPGTIIEEGDWHKLPPEKLILMCTGAQGEKNAVLMRIANAEHRFVELKEGDTVVFSS
ncbi:MAG: Ribonuclease J [Candidatus Magasanikbacteria bacterium]|nr:Ribonuclease J [Candidatus Magasanikbacteria bacterium]